ncbi:unnamed protein product [Phaeothamnion confervicola]
MHDLKDLYLIDLFCGCGGFSTGAVQAGAKVLLAVDCWEEALAVHELNHPETTHLNTKLGGDVEEFASGLIGLIESLPSGSRVHLHGSPPCQNLAANNALRDTTEGQVLVDWYLALMDIMIPYVASYTMEQVANPLLYHHIEKYGGRVVAMKEYGIPQSRRRLFLTNLDLGLIDEFKAPAPTFQQVIDSIGFEMEAPMDALTIGSNRKTNIPGQSKYHYYGLNRISPTVTGQFPKAYSIESGRMRELPIRVFSALQTFPPNYDFGSYSIKTTRQLIGNSVPPNMAKIIMTIAVST